MRQWQNNEDRPKVGGSIIGLRAKNRPIVTCIQRSNYSMTSKRFVPDCQVCVVRYATRDLNGSLHHNANVSVFHRVIAKNYPQLKTLPKFFVGFRDASRVASEGISHCRASDEKKPHGAAAGDADARQAHTRRTQSFQLAALIVTLLEICQRLETAPFYQCLSRSSLSFPWVVSKFSHG
jgi:hypothetical protein